MRIFVDTEFIEDGKTIDLISIGLVREDGNHVYLISNEFDESKASDWVRINVLSKITANELANAVSRATIAEVILRFAGESPEFWGYYADYDWVAICQLYGTMMQLPNGWPMFCMDLKQEAVRRGVCLPKQPPGQHRAIDDAFWVKHAYETMVDVAK